MGGNLYTHLRVAAMPCRKRYSHYDRCGKIKSHVSINERPDIVDKCVIALATGKVTRLSVKVASARC